jgi:hypothetical protein
MKSEAPFPIWLFNLVAFAACFIAFAAFGNVAGYRVLGLVCCVGGAVVMYIRSIPIGIEGRPPSFYISGGAALFVGFLLSLLGLIILLFAKSISGDISWSHSI